LLEKSDKSVFVIRAALWAEKLGRYLEYHMYTTVECAQKNLGLQSTLEDIWFEFWSKFQPSRLIWQLTIEQESTWQVHSTWTMDCCFSCCVILWLTIFGSLWLTSTLTQHYASTLQTLTVRFLKCGSRIKFCLWQNFL